MKYFLYAYVICFLYNAVAGVFFYKNWMKDPDRAFDTADQKELAGYVIVLAFCALSIVPVLNMLGTAIIVSVQCAVLVIQGLTAYRKNQRKQILK